ncbi:MAG TPA: class I SAM-dependent methyltransferase [Solirubrobacteraceae bacterium]|nr:class I SAM-dependent methyltransferase [Solirubrobacteraceae bacterium]
MENETGANGCVVLGQSEIRWRHGGEDSTGRALFAAADLSDMSDELAELGSSWPAVCDCGRERGHILRGLKLHSGMRALEVGAGCGGVSRTLAERCGALDALEPNPERARLAARRLSDIESARVLVGEVEDLPAELTYDLIVMIGVLEYVGGWRGVAERIEFLGRLAARLRPGGHIVCAIENRLGVGYFAGQPDDHSGQLFQGLEDHPRPFPARTFARQELESIFRSAGLHPTALGVFPDYRFPRMIYAPTLLQTPAASLAWRAPKFPSTPHPSHQTAAILDERRLWRSFVENGMGAEFPNSFLVVAGNDGEQQLWPEPQLAAFYSVGRRTQFATESRVVVSGDGIAVERRSFARRPSTSTELVQSYSTEPYQPGREFIDVLIDADDEELGQWLVRYREFLDRELARTPDTVAFDVWPDNLVLSGNELVVVDTEFAHRGMQREEVLWRALVLLAITLSARTVAARWVANTPRELVAELARLAGVTEEVPIDRVVRRQAELMAEIFGGEPGSEAFDEHLSNAQIALQQLLDRPISANVYDSRDAGAGMHDLLAQAQRDRDIALQRAEHAEAGTLAAVGERDAALEELLRFKREQPPEDGARSWSLPVPLRAVASELRRRGARRREP